MAGRPRKYVRPKIRRKCHHCGKMANQPYSRTIVPSFSQFDDIKPWTRGSIKTDRIDLKGNRKVKISHYCNQECYQRAEGLWEE
jgi:hypothetical protein